MKRRPIICFFSCILLLTSACKEPPQISVQRIPKTQTGLQNLRNEPADQQDAGSTSFPTPAGWTRGKSNPMFPSDKFLKVVDNNEVVLSIMSLPASNDWQSNVQRWLGQVDLRKSAEEIGEMTIQTEVDGISSSKIRLFKDDPDSDAIVGIMSVKGSLAWFIKLTGKKKALEKTEDEFDQYVKLLKFP